ncbi:MAG TPA: TraR/DksA C4-type zinc finger protein [Chitinophagaceae bacterium]|nr:TraR/DksA C4-type zinc finger protein [Chitinophagaceae bacterium]
MAIKKKPAPKKSSKPVAKKASKPAKAAKPAAKKPAAKPAKAKPAPKKAAKAPVAKKSAAKPAPKKPVAARKPAEKPVKPAVKVATKPVSKPAVARPEPKPVVQEATKPAPKKSGAPDPQSLVSIKPTAKPVIKKEPPKPSKIVIPKTTTKSAVKYEPDFTKSVLDTTPMQEHTGPTMRYSDSELAEFREIINRKLDAAKKELAYLQGLITRRDEGGDMDEARYMTMEDGSVSMEREQLSQMASRQITFIDHLEKATMRIENKTYGVCRVTGKLIDKARLRAVPHATLSIEAKQMMNK